VDGRISVSNQSADGQEVKCREKASPRATPWLGAGRAEFFRKRPGSGPRRSPAAFDRGRPRSFQLFRSEHQENKLRAKGGAEQPPFLSDDEIRQLERSVDVLRRLEQIVFHGNDAAEVRAAENIGVRFAAPYSRPPHRSRRVRIEVTNWRSPGIKLEMMKSAM